MNYCYGGLPSNNTLGVGSIREFTSLHFSQLRDGILDNMSTYSTSFMKPSVSHAIGFAALLLLYWTWQLLFSPLDIFREEIEFAELKGGRRRKAREISLRRRVIGTLPPVYPNGWFHLLDSTDVGKGEVKSIFAMGEHLAVFRGSDGEVKVLNAYCPHLGANMAEGGRVVGSGCLECPFHGWVFSGETGKCVDIPYSRKVPSEAAVRKWPADEVNGKIYFWYHCDRKEPDWIIPEISQLNTFKYAGRTEHIVNAHVQEIPENAADFAHLGHLHKPVFSSDVGNSHNIVSEFLQHVIEASWSPDEESKHRATMHVEDNIHCTVKGFRIPIKKLVFDVEQLGPGNVHIYVNTAYFKGVLIQTITPTEPMVQRLRHSFYIHPMVPLAFAKLFLILEATQIERDIKVWNNKKYETAPMLVKEEAALAKHRRWFKQFYQENSPKFDSENSSVVTTNLKNLYEW